LRRQHLVALARRCVLVSDPSIRPILATASFPILRPRDLSKAILTVLNAARVVRLHHTPRGAIIQPHSLMGWLLFSSLFAMAAVPYLYATRGLGSPGGFHIENQVIYRSLIFTPLYLGLWTSKSTRSSDRPGTDEQSITVSIATLVAPLTMASSTKPGRFNLLAYPFLLNAFTFTIPLVFIAVILYLSIVGYNRGQDVAVAITDLENVLDIVPVPMVEMMEGVALLESRANIMVLEWEKIWKAYALFIALNLSVRFPCFLAFSAPRD